MNNNRIDNNNVNNLSKRYLLIRKRIKIDGYLEEFNLSKEEADNLIMNARKIVFAD